MTPGEIVRTVIEYGAAGSSVPQNVFFHQLTVATVPDEDVFDAIDAWAVNDWGGDWAQFASEDYSLDNVSAEVMNTDGTVARILGSDAANVLGLTGDAAGAGTAGLIQAVTALPRQRGKKYVPGVGDPQINNNLFTTAAVADLVGLLGQYLAEIPAGGGSGVLIPGLLSSTLEQFVPFSGTGEVSDVPAYQRRRKPNVGS